MEQSAAKGPSIGKLIDQLHAKKGEIKLKDAEKKALEEEAERLELQIMERLDAEETGTGSGKNAAATINEMVVPHVEDWERLYKFIHDNEYYHLLQRRPSTPGCRELFEQGKQIDGVVPFTKRTLNLRSI
jgi:hypothetical protein